jgi:FkbM family methyltransferase
MSLILRLIPAGLIRFAGRLQFKFPFLKGIINRIGHSLAGEGIIQRGAGKGLKFNARGCNPGFLAGTSEVLEQELVLKYCAPGGVVYDLGANAGFYAIIAARAVGHTGKVYAFEPTPTLAERARSNAALNALANVEIVEAAVSDSDGTIHFGVLGDMSVSNSIRNVKDGNAIEVKCVRLDTFVASHCPPTFMLIDIEGAEVQALEGAKDMIKRYRPVIMIEIHWVGEAFMEFFRRELEPVGYQVRTYEGKPAPTEITRYHAIIEISK